MFANLPQKNVYIPLLQNAHVTLSVSYLDHPQHSFFRNADADELIFIHQGSGKIETTYGHLELNKGDYIVIPRGTTYKMFPASPLSILKFESVTEFEQPNRGLLGPNALYDQTKIRVPEAALGSETNLNEYQVNIKRQNEITTVTYPFNPLDVKGWKGSVYPWKISIYDICPIMSHRYHVPPSAHTTFVTDFFVICSFVERPLEDSKHKVLKVPFYHSNIDYDEVLFYHQGNFFSRDNAGAGSMTFHPQGIHHGPHPKAYSAVNDKTYTDEYAVMLDTRFPLNPTIEFLKLEDKNYWKSWQNK
jgi:homogentisate 1,2-dioxygenase